MSAKLKCRSILHFTINRYNNSASVSYVPDTETFHKTTVYGITVSITSYSSETARIQITLDDQGLVAAYADNVEGQNSAASQSVVSECEAGQKVWIESTTTTSYIYGDAVSVYRYTSFSAFLLNAY